MTSTDLPQQPIGHPTREMIDVSGDGLPDLVELGETARWWQNRGNGRFDPPRSIPGAPDGIQLPEPGVQLVDADGDGRADVLVSRAGQAGYYSLGEGNTVAAAFHPYELARCVLPGGSRGPTPRPDRGRRDRRDPLWHPARVLLR